MLAHVPCLVLVRVAREKRTGSTPLRSEDHPTRFPGLAHGDQVGVDQDNFALDHGLAVQF